MFTGIIEEVGTLKGVKRGSKSVTLTIGGKVIFEDMKLGCSIAVNGVCLTVTSFTSQEFTADVMPESMKLTNLGSLSLGSKVNLERAMPANGRFDGHIVAGHVDGLGKVVEVKLDDTAVRLTFRTTTDVTDYIVYKGSVALNGISLTVTDVTKDTFSVSIIPHSLQNTTLSAIKVGDVVNVETDILGRYMEKFAAKKNDGVTQELLDKYGFR